MSALLEVGIALAGTGGLERRVHVVCSGVWSMRSVFWGRNGRGVMIVGVWAEQGSLESRRGRILEGRVSDSKGLVCHTVPYRKRR